MKKIAIICCTAALMVMMNGCSKGIDELPQSGSSLEADSASLPESPTESEIPPLWYSWDTEQQLDPTLPENADKLWSWHHTEYNAFGEFSSFQKNSIIVYDETGENQTELLISLPAACSSEGGDILFNGGFANGNIPIGTLRFYHQLLPEETLPENTMRYRLFDETLQPANERISPDFAIGCYWDVGECLRYIHGSLGENLELAYVIPLNDGYVTMLTFLIAVDMPVDYLDVYDRIALSVKG